MADVRDDDEKPGARQALALMEAVLSHGATDPTYVRRHLAERVDDDPGYEHSTFIGLMSLTNLLIAIIERDTGRTAAATLQELDDLLTRTGS